LIDSRPVGAVVIVLLSRDHAIISEELVADLVTVGLELVLVLGFAVDVGKLGRQRLGFRRFGRPASAP